jgi:hypothetical protein
VAAALDAVALRPPDAFLWFGRRETPAGGAPLAHAIAQRLHGDFFGAGVPRPRRRGRTVAGPDDGGEFVRGLSQANGGRGAWQDDWRIAALDADGDGLRVMRPDGLALHAPAGDVRVEGEIAAGAAAAVLLPKELRGLSPGFYTALGDSGCAAGDALVGLFWNVAAAGAATLVARITYALNGARLAFCLELRDDPSRYAGADAVLLTIARADFGPAIKLLRPLLRALGPHLADGAPAFTKPLARGLAVAELPAGGPRFGEHRCGLLAEAIVAVGGASAAQRLAAVRTRFAAAGIGLDAPYLQPGSADAYDL